ncbi:NAD(P)/FAD-dependent oxidoreductase [Magnetovibrio sp. PR-2]|uniref:NAD(P)/FAD-dependent oxidoreductase n=1 Tax=Magnetovibrio sp. PR-2 TaxID=3120356 RepID=UPI002FCE3981
MTDSLDTVVIGAGVVGLACARAMALAGHEVVVVEALDAIGTVTSSRNSEVIHAGIYYPEGSLKGRLCVQGKAMLYDYLEAHAIEHNRCGKLVVATTDEEVSILKTVVTKAAANGCTELNWLDGDEAQALEPELRCLKALSSPTTGIVDTHGFMLSLQGELEAHGGAVALNAPVLSGDVKADGILLRVGGDQPMEVLAKHVINAAGLDAQKLAGCINGYATHHAPPAHLCKGNYFSLMGKAPFDQLIYPVPGNSSLGCHYTRDLGGQGRFGPDAEWIEDGSTIDYAVNPKRAESFYKQIRSYWPGLPDDALSPAYCGMRPKIQAQGEPAHDFVIQGPDIHDVPGLVNLFGIESPGLTSSLAIGDFVKERITP